MPIAGGSLQGGGTNDTQQRILDMAVDVFAEQGFADASIAEIAKRANASVGSIYYHFGGRRELFLALFDRFVTKIDERIAQTAARTRPDDTLAVVAAHTRAILVETWNNRRTAMVLSEGQGPADYDQIRRETMDAHFYRWTSAIDYEDSFRGKLQHRGIIAIMTQSIIKVSNAVSTEEAIDLIDAATTMIKRIVT